MKRFAKITAVLAAMVLALAFIGCSSGDDDDEPEEKFVTFKTADEKNVLEVSGIEDGKGRYKLTLDGVPPQEDTWKMKDGSKTEIEISMGDVIRVGTIGMGEGNVVITISFTPVATPYTFVRDGHNASEVKPDDGAFVTFKTADGKNVLEVAGINEGNGSFKLTLDGASTPNEGTWKLKDESQTEIEISMGDAKISGTIELDNASGEVKSISFKIEGTNYTFTSAN